MTPLIILGYVAVFFGLLPAGLWAFGGWLDGALDIAPIGGPLVRAVGLALVVTGSAWALWAMALLRYRGDGWPISHLPPARLVDQGPYHWMRHPIYAGYAAAFAGAGLLTGSVGRGILAAAVLAAGALLYARWFEEPGLVRRFGQRYERFRAERRPW